ncbi:MAG: ribosome maturation factor RimM [Candidatus Zixiibacteriota bacterium]|jgi:16S rRNA processing protein RimM
MNKVTIGKISRARGLRGEMVVVPLTDDPERFLKLEKVTLTKDGTSKEFFVEKAREFKGKVLLKLKQVESPEEAKELAGGFIEIEKDQLVRLPQGSYFIFDIVGLEVVTTTGEKIGTVKEVISLPANDLYLVEGDEKLYLIPAVKQVVKGIDLKEKKMIIQPMEGLFDL